MVVPLVYWSTADPLQTLNLKDLEKHINKNTYEMVSVAEFLHGTSQPGRMQFAIAPSTRFETPILPSDPRTPPGHTAVVKSCHISSQWRHDVQDKSKYCPTVHEKCTAHHCSLFSLHILITLLSLIEIEFLAIKKAAISWLALPKFRDFREENFSWHGQTGKPQDYKFCIVPEAGSKEKGCIECRKWGSDS